MSECNSSLQILDSKNTCLGQLYNLVTEQQCYLEIDNPIFHPANHNIRRVHVTIWRKPKPDVAFSFNMNLECHMCTVEVPVENIISFGVQGQGVAERLCGSHT